MLLCWILLLLLRLGGHPAHGFSFGPSSLLQRWSLALLGGPPTTKQRRIVVSHVLNHNVERSSSLVEEDSSNICEDDEQEPIQIRNQQHPQQPYHRVQGLECVAVTIGWPRIHQQQQQQQQQHGNNYNCNSFGNTVTIVEATARSQEVLVDQALENESTATRDSDVYGAVLWPAALVLAERVVLWLLSQQPQQPQHPQKPYKILEVGAGTGLVSLAAARLGGAHSVLATDYHELPLQLLQYAAQHLNPVDDDPDLHDDKNYNNLYTAHLDLCDYINTPLPRPPPDAPANTSNNNNNNNNNTNQDDDFTMMVAADVLYEPATGVALAHRAVEALQRGMRVWIADSPGRAGRTALLQTLHELLCMGDDDVPKVLAFRNVTGWTVTGERHELICGPHSRSVATNSTTPQPLDVAVLELDPAQHRVAAGYHRHTAAVISKRSENEKKPID